MFKTLHFHFATLLFIAVVPTIAISEPTHRGFQTGFIHIDEEAADQLADFWGANVTRNQLQNDVEQDSITNMEDYWTMMDPVLAQFDNYLATVCPKGIKVWAVLYSTPGGFANRSENGQTPHLKIFTEQWAQDGFIEAWREIAQRYADSPYLDCIYGFELANETPQGREPEAGLKDWNDLMLDAISAIRETLPNILIITNPTFANSAKLGKLKIEELATDPNLAFNIHAYPNVKYSHSGLDDIATDIDPPSCKQIKTKFIKPLAKYLEKLDNLKNKDKVPADFNPNFVVGEFAVTYMAKDGDVYFERILSTLETDGCGVELTAAELKRIERFNKAKKKKKKNKILPKSKRWIRYVSDINFGAYTNHAYAESPVWDPRRDQDGNFVAEPSLTPKGEVIKGYLARN